MGDKTRPLPLTARRAGGCPLSLLFSLIIKHYVKYCHGQLANWVVQCMQIFFFISVVQAKSLSKCQWHVLLELNQFFFFFFATVLETALWEQLTDNEIWRYLLIFFLLSLFVSFSLFVFVELEPPAGALFGSQGGFSRCYSASSITLLPGTSILQNVKYRM